MIQSDNWRTETMTEWQTRLAMVSVLQLSLWIMLGSIAANGSVQPRTVSELPGNNETDRVQTETQTTYKGGGDTKWPKERTGIRTT
jgi:hypothetical protein